MYSLTAPTATSPEETTGCPVCRPDQEQDVLGGVARAARDVGDGYAEGVGEIPLGLLSPVDALLLVHGRVLVEDERVACLQCALDRLQLSGQHVSPRRAEACVRIKEDDHRPTFGHQPLLGHHLEVTVAFGDRDRILVAHQHHVDARSSAPSSVIPLQVPEVLPHGVGDLGLRSSTSKARSSTVPL